MGFFLAATPTINSSFFCWFYGRTLSRSLHVQQEGKSICKSWTAPPLGVGTTEQFVRLRFLFNFGDTTGLL